MSRYSVADAKNRLSELIDRALRGEDVIVTRHGAPVVEFRAVTPGPQPLRASDIDWLASRRVPARPGFETASESLAALRDDSAG